MMGMVGIWIWEVAAVASVVNLKARRWPLFWLIIGLMVLGGLLGWMEWR